MFERITLEVQRSLDFLHRTLSFLHIERIVMALPAPIALREHLAQNIGEPIEVLDLRPCLTFRARPNSRRRKAGALLRRAGAALRGRETH
jgi:Tfp pilus assembly PilM family ATPase